MDALNICETCHMTFFDKRENVTKFTDCRKTEKSPCLNGIISGLFRGMSKYAIPVFVGKIVSKIGDPVEVDLVDFSFRFFLA